jgi:hypothetical protein
MMDAFVVRFKYCSSSRCLVELTEDDFFSFPDKYPMYKNRWSDCIGRVIFDSIDDICQEMWCILCKWGQYQGDFPKALFKMRISSVFAACLKDKMSKVGLRSEEKQKLMSDVHCRVQDKLNFRSVKVCDSFVFYLLQSPEGIHSFSTFFGEMSVVGVRKCMPKVNVERVCNQNDLISMLQKIELFLSSTKLRMRLY